MNTGIPVDLALLYYHCSGTDDHRLKWERRCSLVVRRYFAVTVGGTGRDCLWTTDSLLDSLSLINAPRPQFRRDIILLHSNHNTPFYFVFIVSLFVFNYLTIS
jgi:hypothetical protein